MPGQTAARRAWRRVLLPDWPAVTADWDAVHLSWLGLVTTEGRVVSIRTADDERAWLRTVLQSR